MKLELNENMKVKQLDNGGQVEISDLITPASDNVSLQDIYKKARNEIDYNSNNLLSGQQHPTQAGIDGMRIDTNYDEVEARVMLFKYTHTSTDLEKLYYNANTAFSIESPEQTRLRKLLYAAEYNKVNLLTAGFGSSFYGITNQVTDVADDQTVFDTPFSSGLTATQIKARVEAIVREINEMQLEGGVLDDVTLYMGAKELNVIKSKIYEQPNVLRRQESVAVYLLTQIADQTGAKCKLVGLFSLDANATKGNRYIITTASKDCNSEKALFMHADGVNLGALAPTYIRSGEYEQNFYSTYSEVKLLRPASYRRYTNA
jgi:hypothetical protein